MSYRAPAPTAQKATLSDARQRPASWWRKVRRAWPQTDVWLRWIQVTFLTCVAVTAVLIGTLSVTWGAVYVAGVVAPVGAAIVISLTREGLGVLTARRRLRLEQRSRQRRRPHVLRISERFVHVRDGESHLPVCATCGFPGEGPCDM